MIPDHLKHYPASIARRRYGCDCRKCLPSGRPDPGRPPKEEGALSHAARQRKLRHSKKGQPVPPGTKHGVYTARVYACKCDDCRAAKARQNHRTKNPWMYRPTRGRWVEENGTTRLCWPPRGAGPDWVCPHERSA